MSLLNSSKTFILGRKLQKSRLSTQNYIWLWNLSRDWQPHQRNGDIFTDVGVIGGDYQLSQQGVCLIFQEVFWPCELRNNSRKIPAYESLHKHIHPSSSCMVTRHFQLHILLLSWQEEKDSQPLVNTDLIFFKLLTSEFKSSSWDTES